MTAVSADGRRPSASASRIFASRHHPGERSAAYVFALALSRPLAFCLTVLMILGTASMLMLQDPLPWLTVSVPVAMVIAMFFTAHSVRSKPAELLIYGDRAAMRSVWEVAADRPVLPQPFLPPRRVQEGVDVGIGVDLITLTPHEWPDLHEITETLLTIAPPTRPSPV